MMTVRVKRLLLAATVPLALSCTFAFDRELAPGEIRAVLQLALPDGGFEPAVNAQVRVEGSNYGTRADPNGRFVIRGVPDGQYRLRMRHERTFQGQTRVSGLTVRAELEPKGAVDLGALTLDALGGLSGVVEQGVRPGSVSIIVDGESMARSDSGVGYKIPMLEPGRRRLAVQVTEVQTAKLFEGATVDIRPREETVWNFSLDDLVSAPASSITVRTRLSNGADASGVDVELHDGFSMSRLPPTDSAGFASQAEVAAGVYTLVAKKEGYLPSRLTRVVVMDDVTTPDLILLPEHCRPGVEDAECASLAAEDTDGDGIPDYLDHCPDDRLNACAPGVPPVFDAPHYCGSGFQDNDGDGVCAESCESAGLSCGAGQCSDADGTAKCECALGYAGSDCATCAAGYIEDNGACVYDGVISDLVINDFSALSNTLTRGDATFLTASFTGGTGAISPDVGPVRSQTPVSTGALHATTEFTLTVTNPQQETTTRTVEITVVSAPQIHSFSAVSSPILAGQTASLTFVFSDGTGVIDQGVGVVGSGAPVTTPPLFRTTTFTLTVTNAAGDTTTRQVTVEVTQPPQPPVVAIGGDGTQHGKSIAVDGEGNTWVFGTFNNTAEFGATVLTAVGGYDVFVAKMNREGDWLWAVQGVGGGDGDAGGIAVDADGYAWVTGEFNDTVTFGATPALTSRGETDAFVARLSPNGEWQWARQAGGSSHDAGRGIAIDAEGNARVTGYTSNYLDNDASIGPFPVTGPQYAFFMFVASLSPAGDWQWATHSGGVGNAEGYDIAVDAGGNAFVTGHIFGDAVTIGTLPPLGTIGYDTFVAKLSADGQQWLWVARAAGIGVRGNYGRAVAVDATGHVFVAGDFQEYANFNGIGQFETIGAADIFVAKLSPNGLWQWVKQVGGDGNDVAFGLSVAADGDALVTGQIGESNFTTPTVDFGSSSLTSAGARDVFVAKVSSAGVWQWATSAGGLKDDGGRGIAVDAAGDARVTGSHQGEAQFGATVLTGAVLPQAFVANISGDGHWAKATALPPVASNTRSTFEGSASNLVANGNDTLTLTLTVRSAGGDALEGVPVTFVSTEASDALTVTSGVTNTSGQLHTELVSLISGERTFRAVFGWPATGSLSVTADFGAI